MKNYTRLVRADALKLRRRWGMTAVVIAETFGITLLVYTVTALQHAGNPRKHGPAGGLINYHHSITAILMFIVVAGAIVGATAGAADLETGVFRDLAATGRSRVALFASRILGAWAIILPVAIGVSAFTAVAANVLAGPLAAPSVSAIASGTASVLLAAMLSAAVCVGLAALIGSRAPVVTIVLAFQLAISPLLVGVGFLGGARQAIPKVAFDRIANAPHQSVHLALATAILVVIAWGSAAFIAGAWRTKTREI
jgi:ABC-type transport system involved in multi-copper enzyme maturation permease subunit